MINLENILNEIETLDIDRKFLCETCGKQLPLSKTTAYKRLYFTSVDCDECCKSSKDKGHELVNKIFNK